MNGELIKLIRKVKCNESVEKWLKELQVNMQKTVQRFIKNALDKHDAEQEDKNRVDWCMDDHPAQSIIVVGSIAWTRTTECMLSEDEDIIEGLEWWLGENISQLQGLTKVVARTDLDDRKRKAVVALIT